MATIEINANGVKVVNDFTYDQVVWLNQVCWKAEAVIAMWLEMEPGGTVANISKQLGDLKHILEQEPTKATS